MKNHYETLGVKGAATLDEIRRAFRKLASKLHPDRNPGDKLAEARFKDVSTAYSVLSDPKQRDTYDRQLQGPPSNPAGFTFTEPDFVRQARARRQGRRVGGTPFTVPAAPHAPSAPIELGKTYKVGPDAVPLGPIAINQIPPWMFTAGQFQKRNDVDNARKT